MKWFRKFLCQHGWHSLSVWEKYGLFIDYKKEKCNRDGCNYVQYYWKRLIYPDRDCQQWEKLNHPAAQLENGKPVIINFEREAKFNGLCKKIK